MSSWLSLCCGLILLCRPVTEVHSCATISNAYERQKKIPAQGVLVFSAGRDLRMNMGRTFVTGYARSCVNTPNGRQVESSRAVVGAFRKIRRKKAAKGAAVVVAVVMRKWSVVRDGDTSVA